MLYLERKNGELIRMDPMEIFWLVWMLVLPVLGVTLMILFPLFWFFIVPPISRMLAWMRFKKVSFHVIADDTGYVSILPTTEEIPEGIVKTKKGYRFLPRPKWKKTGATNLTVEQARELLKLPEEKREEILKQFTEEKDNPGNVASLLLRKFIWKDMGKPIWLGYAGKVAAVNPVTLAGLQQSQSTEPLGDPKTVLANLQKYVDDLPKTLTVKGVVHQKNFNLRGDLTKFVKDLQTEINILPLTIIDPTKIKEVISQMYTPSQLDALATNREMYGMKKRGQEYGKLILGGALIIGLVILGIVALMALSQ